MESDLDKKLEEIYWGWPQQDKPGEFIKTVKQAFIDAGYVQYDDRMRFDVHGKLEINGREWYDRFEKDLDNWFREKYNYDHLKENIESVAKKAAGIEQ